MKKIAVLLILLLTNLAGHAEDKSRKPLLVASIKPLALMANDLAGDWLEVQTLLGDNQEPHHVSLSISQRRKVLEADLVIWVSPQLEAFLVKVLEPLDKQKLLSFQSALPSGASHEHDYDFHYWLAPALAADFYRALADRLKQLFPQKQAVIAKRLSEILPELTKVSERIKLTLSAYSDKSVIVDHQAYGYFTGTFDVNVVGALVDESGVPVGPRTMAALADHMDVSCIAVERLPPPRRAVKIASMLDITFVAIDPLGLGLDAEAGYPGLLDAVATGFESCFRLVK